MTHRLPMLGDEAPVDPARLPQIRSKAGYVYQVTPEDVLWLARTAQFEGGTDRAATIWTYAQRQAFYRRQGSLTSLIRGHSQPLNPLWESAGVGKCAEYPERCTPQQIERRRIARTVSWEGLQATTRDLVTRWIRGDLPNPVPGAVDFADATVTAAFIRRHPATRIVKQAGNWYIAYGPEIRGGTLVWPADHVTLNVAGRIVGASVAGLVRRAVNVAPYIGIGVAGVAMAGGFAAWAIWRHKRRPR